MSSFSKKQFSSVVSIALCVLIGGFNTTLAAEAEKPNIIVIYTDDQGYGDVSALNPEAKFQTPHMDRIAREGIIFSNGHSADTVCTPSRYGLLTGRYPWRTTRKSGVMGAAGKGMIADARMTLASLLRDQGYHTAMVGKWHLGMTFPKIGKEFDWSKPIEDMPLDKGFDYFFGVPASLNFGILAWFEGRTANVPPTMRTGKKKNPRYVDYRVMPPYKNKGGFPVAPDFIDNQCLTRFTDKAIEWMGGKAADAKMGRPFFLYLPYTSPHYPVCPLPEFHGQGGGGPYGEFLIETDYHVGRILDFLEESDLDDNTLIVFTSDNGPERSWSARLEETGHDSRGGFRGGKRAVYEGGHRVPFLVRWPSGIKQPGREWDKIVGQVDLLATFAEITGATLPDNAGEDSQSFAEILINPETNYTRLPIINRGESGSANHGEAVGTRYSITQGHWKLVLPGRKSEAELYDLSVDLAESKNLAAAHPEKVQQLQKQITEMVLNGRTTPGAVQPNDTGYWKDLTWMTKADF